MPVAPNRTPPQYSAALWALWLAPTAFANVSLQPDTVQPGGIVVATLRLPATETVVEVRGSLLGVPPKWYEDAGARTALVPVPADAAAGRTPFYVKAQFASGATYSDIAYVTVLSRAYTEQRMRMAQSKTGLMDRELLRQERELLYASFDNSSPTQQWRGPFQVPVKGRFSSPWGRKRYVNGKWWGQHQGADIAAGTGTPVKSDAGGTVVFAQELRMRGNTVVVDHGRNLFSAYNHLSRIDVTVGQRVNAGQLLGAVGATGFSTGAHLHWEVRVGRTSVDPMLLVKTSTLTAQ